MLTPEPITEETLPLPPAVRILIRDPFLNFFSNLLSTITSCSSKTDLSISPFIVSANSEAWSLVGDKTNMVWYLKNKAWWSDCMANVKLLPILLPKKYNT